MRTFLTRMPRVVTKNEILSNFKRPGHPTAFSAPHAVSQFYSIPLNKAKEALQHEDAYNLHREYKRPAVYNPYYVYERRKLIQADLIDISQISQSNDNKRYLLLLIDVFTRRIWVFPMETKSAREMVRKLQRWLAALDVSPSILMTDSGTEFVNAPVKALLDQWGIQWRRAVGTSKACYAERANKSFQILIFKYLTALETLRYIDILPDLITTYNTRPHRSLEKMTPADADHPRMEAAVRAIHIRRYNKVNGRRKSPIFKVGDRVRIKTDSKAISSSRRAYAEQFHGEYFKVINVNTHLPIPMYTIESMDTGERIE